MAENMQPHENQSANQWRLAAAAAAAYGGNVINEAEKMKLSS
jgi:hypothetical protein